MPYICMAFHSSFNTQPPEGGWVLQVAGQERRIVVSTHSRPKAAGIFIRLSLYAVAFQHTAARRRLENYTSYNDLQLLFQHTAARRRLV